MAYTKIADVIVPEVFTHYTIERTAELSVFVRSGIVSGNPLLNEIISGGGATINMPSWNDLSGESQVMNDVDPITSDKITAKNEIAPLLVRASSWASHELAGVLAGDDPQAAIVQLVAAWWARDEQRILFKLLDGVFDAASMVELVADNSADKIDAEMLLDAKQLLGDAADKLTALGMHSATYTELQKQNLIEYIPNARGEVDFPSYMKYRIIIDDGVPAAGGVYTTYLFASGSIARGEGVPPTLTPTATDRDEAMSTDYLFNRRAFVLHPRGVSWQGAPVGVTPSNAELAVGTNWKRVSELKNMGIVKLMHTIK